MHFRLEVAIQIFDGTPRQQPGRFFDAASICPAAVEQYMVYTAPSRMSRTTLYFFAQIIDNIRFLHRK